MSDRVPPGDWVILPGMENVESREQVLRQELMEWWSVKSLDAAERTIPKAVQYGERSLEMVGEVLMKAIVPERAWSKRMALEIACVFYAFGKLSRAWGSIERGELPQDDDLFDLGVYARMAERIQETGRWV